MITKQIYDKDELKLINEVHTYVRTCTCTLHVTRFARRGLIRTPPHNNDLITINFIAMYINKQTPFVCVHARVCVCVRMV